MKAYVSDTEDLKQDPSYQETWDDMIINVCFCLLFGTNVHFQFSLCASLTP